MGSHARLRLLDFEEGSAQRLSASALSALGLSLAFCRERLSRRN
jgi:hypothetical protein